MKTMNALTLKEIHKNNKGKASDKWESYLDYYDELFLPFKNKKVSLMEIGVQNGGSLTTFSEYFSNFKDILGCDINEKCKLLKYNNPKIKVVVGNVNTNETFNEIVKIIDSFDIIIDDGSHMSSDIIISFIRYFSLLSPGGIYVIEDIHTLYSSKYGGGLFNENSAMNFFRKLSDVVNYQFWNNKISLNDFFTTFFPSGVPSFINEGWIESIEFRNSIITIKKSLRSGHNKLGVRLKTGDEMQVFKL